MDTIEGAVMETGMRVVAGTNELQKVRVSLCAEKVCCRWLTPTSSTFHVRMVELYLPRTYARMHAGTNHLHER